MSVQLLDKTRKINKLLHNNSSSKVVFNDICDVLTGILDSDILVISKKGKVLGSSVCKGVDELQELIVDEVGGYIDPDLNERLLGILSTKENVNLETLGFGEESRRYRVGRRVGDLHGNGVRFRVFVICNGAFVVGQRAFEIIYREYGDRFAVAGIGGVFTPQQAYEKIRCGSSLVMFISALMYRGPQQITVLKRGLAELLRRDGFEHVSEAVGIDA